MKSIIATVVVLAILIAGLNWYRAKHPSGLVSGNNNTSTTTPSSACAIGKCPTELTENDSGRTLTYAAGDRLTIYLNHTKNPSTGLHCDPSGIVGVISIITSTSTPLYAARMEAVKTGICNLKNNNFLSIMKVEDTGGLENLTKDWSVYENPQYKISFKYPKDWTLAQNQGTDRYQGPSGFFAISAAGGTASIDDIVESDVTHVLRPYGRTPIIESITVDNQEARIIIPSSDAGGNLNGQAELIVKFPNPIRISGTAYYYFILWADKEHIRDIASTLHFT
ncbi:hypothetical protein KW790_02680 [Candidatus Parcubacteria bacterium]|nr:hypothetical protein [Candidatus Parcubacteria bacterium]